MWQRIKESAMQQKCWRKHTVLLTQAVVAFGAILRFIYKFFSEVLRRMRWVGHVARMGEKRITYRLLVGKPKT
jgi:hypothetical protein